MPKSLPPYETIVRWTVKDVTDWLKEAGLGEFKDHITKHSIDGNKLASLSDFDVNNFVGKSKKKIELQNHINSIKKPKNVPSRSWNPPQPTKSASNSKNGYDSDSGDSIYSWGDEFSDEDGGKEDEDDEDDDENYIDIDNEVQVVTSTQKDEELYEEPQDPQDNSKMPIITSLQAALLEFQANRGHSPTRGPSPTRFKHDSTESPSDSEAGYLRPVYKKEPEAGPRRPPPSTPGQRPPQPVPPTAAPLLPGQKIPTVKSKKSVPKPPADEYYEDPDKQTVSKPQRRAPPPPPPDSPPPEFVEQEYLNLEQIEADRKRKVSIPQINPPPIPTGDDGYIKYNPNNQDVYEEPDEEEAKPEVPPNRSGGRPKLPSIPTQKETGRKISLPPVPNSLSRKSSKEDTSTRKTSQPDTPSRKTSQPDTPTRRTSQPDTPTRKTSQPDQADEMNSFEWYHNDLERAIAENRLKNYNHDGMFLVRKSLKGGQVHPYTLMVFYKSRVFNFPVRKRDSDGKFALGKKDSPDDLAFDTVDALIQNYQKVYMILQGTKGQGSTAKLTKPLPK